MATKPTAEGDMAYNRSVIPLAKMCQTCPEASTSICNNCTKWHESEFKKGTDMTAPKRDRMAEAESKAAASKPESKETIVTTAKVNTNDTAPKATSIVTAITKDIDALVLEGCGILDAMNMSGVYSEVEYTPFRRIQRKDGSGSFIASKVKVTGMGMFHSLDFYMEDGVIKPAMTSYEKNGAKVWTTDVAGTRTGLAGREYGQWKSSIEMFLTGLLFIMNKQTVEEIAAL